MSAMFNILALLPGYLIFLTFLLVIIPTIVAIFLRFSLYSNLHRSEIAANRLLGDTKLESVPRIITRLERRFAELGGDRREINTVAIIEGAYSQEKFKFLGLPLNYEAVDNFGRILPNLLLSFGLLGTFLGITINLANLSQTITQVDVTNVRSLVEELDKPLQGMGVAFVSSLIAIACSSLLAVINLLWNTRIAKANLLSTIEDYIDNIYLPQIQPRNAMEQAIDRFSDNFELMLAKLGNTIEESITKAFLRIEDSAASFERAANVLDSSRFPEKLAVATNDLAIAQNQFSQSSLVLQRSTQSFEHSFDTMEKLTRRFIALNEQVSQINQKYNDLVNLNQQQNAIDASGLKEIKHELARLIQKMQQLS
ncbi:methyl-accepting chemotaxis protein [Myxosarcina sp. GI1(2024)]